MKICSRLVPIAFLFVGVCGFNLPAHARTPSISQVRLPGESLQEAETRSLQGFSFVDPREPFWVNARQAAKPLSQVNFTRVPEWKGAVPLMDAFRRVRDLRFLRDPEHTGFMRRLSWLYPDGGCQARAAYAVKNMKRWGYAAPAKLFIFGKLSVATVNSPVGKVYWWFHVVPTMRLGRVVYVFDPAIDPSSPLTLQAWLRRMDYDPAELKVSVCDSSTYVPLSPCYEYSNHADFLAAADQNYFLAEEWKRMIELGRSPWEVLGDHPPWD